ncbi:MAG: ATP-binding cassette domain-containing protein [Thermoleophilia bacterium]
MKPASNAIDVAGLSKSYGSIQALRGADLKVSPAQGFGLVGPNGSGKTTLIKALCGILKPDAGAVRVLGLRADRDRYSVRKHRGYMPRSPALYEDLSPAENLRFFGGGFRIPDLGSALGHSHSDSRPSGFFAMVQLSGAASLRH